MFLNMVPDFKVFNEPQAQEFSDKISSMVWFLPESPFDSTDVDNQSSSNSVKLNLPVFLSSSLIQLLSLETATSERVTVPDTERLVIEEDLLQLIVKLIYDLNIIKFINRKDLFEAA